MATFSKACSLKYEFAPSAIKDMLLGIVKDEVSPCFAQVATVNQGSAQVRTVHLRYLEEHRTIGFNTYTGSSKWKALGHIPKLSGCYYDPNAKIQFRWEGSVQMLEGSLEENRRVLERLWHQTRSDVRKCYWKEYLRLPFDQSGDFKIDLGRICPTFGTVLCIPNKWDVYEMTEDYANDKRSIYLFENELWHFQRVSTLSGNPF